MDSYNGHASWGSYSTLDMVPGTSAYSRTPSQAPSPSYQPDLRFMGSPALSDDSMDWSPSPAPSEFPQTPTLHSPRHASPIIRNHGSPLLAGSGYLEAHGSYYREYDISNHFTPHLPSPVSGYSTSVLCPQYLASSCQPSYPRPEPVFRKGKRGPMVPQKHYSTHFSAGKSPKTIHFQLAGANESGVPMRLLCGEYAPEVPIEDAHGQVFTADVPTTITLRIWWPGYDVYPRRVTMRKSTGLLNRIELAMIITDCFKGFVDDAQPLLEGASPADAKWRVGKGRIDVNDLVLLSLYQVSKGSFQADVRLELERR